jgi:hypothetical protein
VCSPRLPCPQIASSSWKSQSCTTTLLVSEATGGAPLHRGTHTSGPGWAPREWRCGRKSRRGRRNKTRTRRKAQPQGMLPTGLTALTTRTRNTEYLPGLGVTQQRLSDPQPPRFWVALRYIDMSESESWATAREEYLPIARFPPVAHVVVLSHAIA